MPSQCGSTHSCLPNPHSAPKTPAALKSGSETAHTHSPESPTGLKMLLFRNTKGAKLTAFIWFELLEFKSDLWKCFGTPGPLISWP